MQFYTLQTQDIGDGYMIWNELRQNIPILFYRWDDLPDPHYNRDYYESCDWLDVYQDKLMVS